ncbi:MAG: RloB domain-containing protein [Porticoccus sp.]|nr:RloB domain-containing protein [Porticoccus sp.]
MPRPRRNASKKLRPVLHIFCEGEKTEPNYINGYLRKFHASNRLLKVIKVEKTDKNTPVQLVEEAIKLKEDKDTPALDFFWVVYDREAESKYSDTLHREALDKAQGKNIKVSLTTICFEVWLLLHFSDTAAPYSSCSDLLKNSSLNDELNKLGIKKYDKASNDIFELISDRIPDARVRAERMNDAIIKSSSHNKDHPYSLNPYTGVHLLLDAIDDFVEKFR